MDTSTLQLTPEETANMFAEVRRTSVVQRLARQVPMGPTGVKFPVWTGKPVAGFVNEGEAKPVSDVTATIKSFTPEKLAVIVPVSAELVRYAQGTGLLGDIQADMVEAIAKAFDEAVLHGVNTPYGEFLANTGLSVQFDGTDAYGSLNGALRTLLSGGKKLTGWALDPIIEPDLNAAGANGAPSIFVDNAADSNFVTRAGRLLGRQAVMTDGVAPANGSILGFAGDFSQIVWGQVSGVSIDVTDQASIVKGDGTTLHLWQRNMLALRAEVEYGVLVNDVDSFVKITPAPVGS